VGTVAVLAISGLGVYGVAVSAHQLWVQHSGTAAQVRIEHCDKTYTYGGRGRAWTPKTCSATWRQPDGTRHTVTIQGPKISPGQTVEVRLIGDDGYTTGSWPWHYLLVGIAAVCLLPAAILINLRRRRRGRDGSDSPDHP
jgi:hypothetical protein